MAHIIRSDAEPCGNFGSCALPTGHNGGCRTLPEIWDELERLAAERSDADPVRVELPYLAKLVCWAILLELWGVLELIRLIVRDYWPIVRGWL